MSLWRLQPTSLHRSAMGNHSAALDNVGKVVADLAL